MKEKMEEIAVRLAITQELTGKTIETFGEASKSEEEKPIFDTYDAFKTDRRCKVCTSPHRAEYEEFYLTNGGNIPQVWAYAQTIGEKEISERAFYRHFRNHFNPLKEAERFSRQLFERAVQEKIKYAEGLAQTYLLAKRIVDTLLQRLGETIEGGGEVKGKEIAIISTLLPELRQYAKQIRELEGEEE